MSWYLSAISNYATFTGRARPKAFWMFVLFNIIIAFAIAVINYLAVPHRFDEEPTAAVQDGGIYLLS